MLALDAIGKLGQAMLDLAATIASGGLSREANRGKLALMAGQYAAIEFLHNVTFKLPEGLNVKTKNVFSSARSQGRRAVKHAAKHEPKLVQAWRDGTAKVTVFKYCADLTDKSKAHRAIAMKYLSKLPVEDYNTFMGELEKSRKFRQTAVEAEVNVTLTI